MSSQPGRLIPLAWRNLIENRWRLAASVAGAAFAVVLMFSQIGFRNALLDNMAAVISHLDGDFFLINRQRYMLSTPASFPLQRLDLVRGLPSVASASPFYIEIRPTTRWRNLLNGFTRHIRVLAYNPDDDLLLIPEVRDQRPLWSVPDTALADNRSKSSVYGPLDRGQTSELNDRRLRIVGQFSLGTDFRSNGTLLMSEKNFFRFLPERALPPLSQRAVDVGVIRVKPDTPLNLLEPAFERVLTPDLALLTKADFVAREHRFWQNVAPIGIVFNIGLVMGFVVGTGICYQILFSEISDRLAEFATLKAMGYTNRRLLSTIVAQGVYLALLGYALGLALSLGLFRLLENQTGLKMALRPSSLLLVLALTVIMCVSSGLLAGRRLSSADPAELFS